MTRSRTGRSRLLTILLLLVLTAIAGGYAWVRMRMHGPFRDYRVDTEFISGPAESSAEPLSVGIALREITPNLGDYDPWTDADHNSRFEPAKGDTYEDRNQNGDFDLVWLGGFNVNRPAQGVNDPLWVRAIAFR